MTMYVQMCFSDCNQLIETGYVNMEIRAIISYAYYIQSKLHKALAYNQHSQNHNRLNSIHHWDWKEQST